MKAAELRGMDAKIEHLMRSAQAGRIVHALLLTGPHGTGKHTAAGLITGAALCTGVGKRPCGVCPACKKCIDGVHPDVHVVSPEKNLIRVDAIRALIDAMGMTAYEGGRKIAIIERAELMNESAQNALLKTLENPVGDAMFILLTEASGVLLPTIRSRCLSVRFSCLSEADCAAVLEARGIARDRARLLAELAQGSVGRALEIDADPDYLALRTRVIAAMEELSAPADVQRASQRIGSVKGREDDVLEILEQYATALMRAQNGLEPTESAAHSRYVGSLLLRKVMRARRQLKANLTWINVFEPMAFELILERQK